MLDDDRSACAVSHGVHRGRHHGPGYPASAVGVAVLEPGYASAVGGMSVPAGSVAEGMVAGVGLLARVGGRLGVIGRGCGGGRVTRRGRSVASSVSLRMSESAVTAPPGLPGRGHMGSSVDPGWEPLPVTAVAGRLADPPPKPVASVAKTPSVVSDGDRSASPSAAPASVSGGLSSLASLGHSHRPEPPLTPPQANCRTIAEIAAMATSAIARSRLGPPPRDRPRSSPWDRPSVVPSPSPARPLSAVRSRARGR